MISIRTATVAALLAAATLSVLVARRRSAYRVVSALLVYTLGATIVRAQIIGHIIRPAKTAIEGSGIDPLVGALPYEVIVAGHLDHALFLGWAAGIAAIAIAVFLREPGHAIASVAAPIALVGVGWIAAVSVLVLGYEQLRGHAAQAVYLPTELASLLVSIGCIVRWTWRRVSPQIEHAAVAFVVGVECLTTVTLSGRMTVLWPLARWSYLVLYFVLVIIQGGALWYWSRSSRVR